MLLLLLLLYEFFKCHQNAGEQSFSLKCFMGWTLRSLLWFKNPPEFLGLEAGQYVFVRLPRKTQLASSLTVVAKHKGTEPLSFLYGVTGSLLKRTMAAHQWVNMAAIASVSSSGEYCALEEEQRMVLRASLD